jgi:hypothetical protein
MDTGLELLDSRAMRYAVLCEVHPEWAEWKRRVEAGYSRNTGQIARTRAFRQAVELVERHRDLLRACPETSMGAAVAIVAGIAHKKDAEDRDRIRAVERMSKMLGYDAPERVEVTGSFLIRDLSGLAGDELEDIAAALQSGAEDAEVVSGAEPATQG